MLEALVVAGKARAHGAGVQPGTPTTNEDRCGGCQGPLSSQAARWAIRLANDGPIPAAAVAARPRRPPRVTPGGRIDQGEAWCARSWPSVVLGLHRR